MYLLYFVFESGGFYGGGQFKTIAQARRAGSDGTSANLPEAIIADSTGATVARLQHGSDWDDEYK